MRCQVPVCPSPATVRWEFENLVGAQRIVGFDDRRPAIQLGYYCRFHFHEWLERILEDRDAVAE